MKVLFVASYVPPVNGSASIRTLYYINYLVEMGHTVHVLTIDYPRDFVRYDDTLQAQVNPEAVFYPVSPGSMYLKVYPRKDSVQLAQPGKPSFSRKVKSMIKANLAIPDSYIGWIKHAYAKGVELIQTNQYDVMFSMHESPSCHLLAHRLKRRYPKLSWVGYWSDPWSRDPGRAKNPWLRKQIEFYLEKHIVRAMDRYLFTTEETRQMYIDMFHLRPDQTDIVYRGYDLEMYQRLQQEPTPLCKDKINLVYTGDIYTRLRDLRPFMAALRRLQMSHPQLYENIQIILIGVIDSPEIKQELSAFSCIKLMDRVAYEISLGYMVHSEIVLLWGNKNSNQIPGKVYEYIGTNNIIFTIQGDESDPLGGFMKELNRGPIVENQDVAIEEAMINMLERLVNKTVPAEWNRVVEKFQWKNVVMDLYQKLQI